MKIEISDPLFEQYERLIAERFRYSNVAEHIEQLLERELRKHCVPGYELDGLTGAKSRDQLEQDIHRALRGESWSDQSIFQNRYLCLNIDDFRSYIDLHGITRGDEVLVEIARALGEKYPGASLYRVGGDEFVVELGGLAFNPVRPINDITLKYSIVNVKVQRNSRRDHASRLVMFHLDHGIVEASKQGSILECEYPDSL